jgi:hypothetical protein
MSYPPERLAKPLPKQRPRRVQFLPFMGEIGTQITAKVSRQNGLKYKHQTWNPRISGRTSNDDFAIEKQITRPMPVLKGISTQKYPPLLEVQPEISEAASNVADAGFSRQEAILLTFALLLIIFASLFLIGSKSVWLDEAYSIQLVHSWPIMWSQLFIYDHNAWLYYALLYGWARLGDSEAYIRGFSALFAIASLPVYYLLARKLFGKKVALIAVFLLAANGFYIQYAQEARSYSLYFFLSLLSTLMFIYMMQKQTKLWYALYIFCVILCFYAHAFAIFLLPIHGLIVLYTARSIWKQYAICAILIIAGAFPILYNPAHAHNALGWLPPIHLLTIGAYFLDLSAGQPVLCLLYAMLCGIATIWILRMIRKERKVRTHTAIWKYAFVYMWLFIPLLLALSYSLLVFPIYVPRYLITGLAPLLLLVGIGITKLKHRLLFSLCLASIGILSCLSMIGWYTGTNNQHLIFGLSSTQEDWRTAVSYVCNQADDNDDVTFYAYYVHTPYDYYEQNSTLCLSKHIHEIELVPSLSAKVGTGDLPAPDKLLLKNLPTAANRVWLIISHSNVHAKNAAKLKTIQQSLAKDYAMVSIKKFAGIEIQLYAHSDAKPIPLKKRNDTIHTQEHNLAHPLQSRRELDIPLTSRPRRVDIVTARSVDVHGYIPRDALLAINNGMQPGRMGRVQCRRRCQIRIGVYLEKEQSAVENV